MPTHRNPTIDAIAAALTRHGWRMRVLRGGAVEFTSGPARVELPRTGGALTVEHLDVDGVTTVWGAAFTAQTPATAVVDLAIAAAA